MKRECVAVFSRKGNRQMRIIRAKDYDEMSRKAAEIIAAQITLEPETILGLATGSTPLGTYAQLAKWCSEGKLDFSLVETYNLDEYVGLGVGDEQSYVQFMRDNFFSKINIDLENTHLPDGKAEDPDEAAADYEEMLLDIGAVDIQLLGIGHDGHIGFNEPGDEFVGPVHQVTLDPMTIEANKRFFDSADDVPRTALTMGIADIMRAYTNLMVITGKDKAEITHDALFGPVTPKVQASILQFHPDVIVVADEDALSKCSEEELALLF